MPPAITPEEQRIVNEAATAVRRIVNDCPDLPSYVIRSFEATSALLELLEDTSAPASRPLRAVEDSGPLRVA